MLNATLLNLLASALLAGDQDAPSMRARWQHAAGTSWRGVAALVDRYLSHFSGKTRPRRRDVVQFLLHDERFKEAQAKHFTSVPIRHWLSETPSMLPALAASTWQIPAVTSIGELSHWLRLTPGELAWFADLNRLSRRSAQSALDHYFCKLVAKRSGGLRLIEAPKQHLKLLQRQLLTEILDHIPVHAAAHGFVRGRSIRTFAAPHAGRRAVLRMDIENFFPSISAARIEAFFRTAGYPESVARLLAGVCAHAMPDFFWPGHQRDIDVETATTMRRLYGPPHLPQGGPTSPALANLCAYRLDCRLHGLAKSAGATYTRYADDLAFSGDGKFSQAAGRFADHVGAILLEEGFRAHYRKTRIMRRGVRQQLAGLVTNQHLNIARDDFDRLKATLTNCIRRGPQSQNHSATPDFQAHLSGRVGYIESVNPARGAKLRSLFNQIRW